MGAGIRGIAARGVRAYVRTVREATPNARRYLMVGVLQNIGVGLLGTAFALFIRASGMSPAVVGDVEGALALASGIACLVVPPLVALVGYRWLLVAAGAAFSMSRLGQTLGVGPTLIVALGLGYGLGDGIQRSVGVAFLSENGPAGSKRTMLFTVDFALRIAASLVGAVAGGLLPTLLHGFMSDVDALRWTLVLASAVFLASALPALGLREPSRDIGGSIGTRMRDVPNAHGGNGRLRNAWASYVRSVREFRSWRRLASLAVPEAIISLGAGLVMPFVPLLLNVHLGANVAQIGVIGGVTSLAMFLATLLTPLLARKLGLMGTVVTTQLVSLPFLLMIPLGRSLAVVAVAMWVRTALMNMAWPVYNQVAVENVPAQDKPLVSGWVAVAWSIAWLAGSALGGRVAASSYTVGYFITAALYAIGAVVAWILLRHIRPATEESVEASEIVAQGLAYDVAEPRA